MQFVTELLFIRRPAYVNTRDKGQCRIEKPTTTGTTFLVNQSQSGIGKICIFPEFPTHGYRVVKCRATGKYSVQATSGPSCLWHLHINGIFLLTLQPYG